MVMANDFQLLKQGDPQGKYYMPAMSDAPLRGYKGRHEWFWEPGDEAHIFPLEHLMDMYLKSVGRNTSLIIGLTPDTAGLMPMPDVLRLREWGSAIKQQFENPLAKSAGSGYVLEMPFKKTQGIDQVLIMEDIVFGERIRKFVLEAKTATGWQTITEGSCIGHKYLHRFPEVRASALRLRITEALDTPQIKSLQVFGKNN
ncbi:MAG: hypothetical protein EAY75_01965 [Bacteroidetes bacterium]|nr:MAG: hypothetical protein EAY75_01965 [Bacteroidota bacterium]